jgi:anti-sigma regulatory factor (Ser/Thr protein kinase)
VSVAAIAEPLPHEVVDTYPGAPRTVADIRTAVAERLDGTGLPIADAVLCVSELATNAIRHTRSGLPGGHLTVYVGHSATTVRIIVVDDGPLERVPDPERSGGWGMRIVADLATDYGDHQHPVSGCHAAWFQIGT